MFLKRAPHYSIVLVLFLALWATYMFSTSSWGLFAEFWPISATMAFGSFIAGSTPGGGAAVSFPVFTKLLNIGTADARTFGLMIQSLGMLMAALFIVSRKIPILPRVILWVTLGGILGQILGTFWIILPSAPTRVLFTFVTLTFGIALALNRWVLKSRTSKKMPHFSVGQCTTFFLWGTFGGIFAANTGAGIDMLTFILLTLAFGIHEKVSTPTTVTIMGINALVGTILRVGFVHDIGITWDYWLVAAPVVILGAPFGAWCMSKMPRDWLIIFLEVLIAAELITTLYLVPFDRPATLVALGSVIIGTIAFFLMLRFRRTQAIVNPHRT